MEVTVNNVSVPMEYMLAYNSFKKELVMSGVNAQAARLVNLLYMRPGTVPSYPELGIWIESRKHILNNKEEVEALISTIKTQAQKVLPDFVSDIQAKEVKEGFLYIEIYTLEGETIQMGISEDEGIRVDIVEKDFT